MQKPTVSPRKLVAFWQGRSMDYLRCWWRWGCAGTIFLEQQLLAGCGCVASSAVLNLSCPFYSLSGSAGVNHWQQVSTSWPSGQESNLLRSPRRAFSPNSSFEVPSPQAQGS